MKKYRVCQYKISRMMYACYLENSQIHNLPADSIIDIFNAEATNLELTASKSFRILSGEVFRCNEIESNLIRIS